jgi:SsrA-binding protein
MSIAENRRAHFDYHLEERHEAGMVLQGWEIKAIRAGQVQLTDGYVVIRDGELYLIGCRINALRSASTHVSPEADRTKKLLMHKEEIKRLIGKVEQKGFTLVPLNLHFKDGRVKAEIALAKGKAEHDKRNTEKKRDWEREQGRLMRHKVPLQADGNRSEPQPDSAPSACSTSWRKSSSASSPIENRTSVPRQRGRSRSDAIRYGTARLIGPAHE